MRAVQIHVRFRCNASFIPYDFEQPFLPSRPRQRPGHVGITAMTERPVRNPLRLTEAEIYMLRLIALGKPLPWDPVPLVRLQALRFIDRDASSPHWSITDSGADLLNGKPDFEA